MRSECFIGLASFMVCFLLSAMGAGCSAGETTIHNRQKLVNVRMWAVVYTYETGMDEPTTWVQDRTVIPSRTPQSNLDLGDAIFFRLKERFQVPVTREETKADGIMRLHAINFVNGGCKVLHVTMLDRNNEVLARARIYPDFRKANFSYTDSFPEDAAASIAGLLVQAQKE